MFIYRCTRHTASDRNIDKQMLLKKAIFEKGHELGKIRHGRRRTRIDLKEESRSPGPSSIVSPAAKQYIYIESKTNSSKILIGLLFYIACNGLAGLIHRHR